MESNILQKDIEYILHQSSIFSELKNQTIMVTGATGLIGSLLIKTCLTYSLQNNANIKIVALVRNIEKARTIFADYLDSNLILVVQDIREPITYSDSVDYIFHTANNTASKSFVTYPVETILTAFSGTYNVLEFAKHSSIKKLVYLSSLEIYGIPENSDGITYLDEDSYHYLNSLDVRSSYSEGKKAAETLCAAYAHEFQIPVTIARLTQTFGAGVDYYDTRVFAEFSRCAIEGTDIILHTKGETIRNYCYTMDAINALVYIALRGENGYAYNVANENTCISIYEMAQKFAYLSDIPIKVSIQESPAESRGYNPVIKVALVNTGLKNLGWKPCYNLDQMFTQLYQWMKEIRS